jgi:t-SNARE complex subunit (syntaxin)
MLICSQAFGMERPEQCKITMINASLLQQILPKKNKHALELTEEKKSKKIKNEHVQNYLNGSALFDWKVKLDAKTDAKKEIHFCIHDGCAQSYFSKTSLERHIEECTLKPKQPVKQ